jgi:hypothetical protein
MLYIKSIQVLGDEKEPGDIVKCPPQALLEDEPECKLTRTTTPCPQGEEPPQSGEEPNSESASRGN